MRVRPLERGRIGWARGPLTLAGTADAAGLSGSSLLMAGTDDAANYQDDASVSNTNMPTNVINSLEKVFDYLT